MPRQVCPNCESTDIVTDMQMGNSVCNQCFAIVDDNLFVAEVGFAEGAGGRVHVQGTFVSHNATGFGGRGGEQSLEQTKTQGKDRIRRTADAMGIDPLIWRQAQRFFVLLVDASFNRGRRSEYLIASCLYLSCRMNKSDKMLIDFSERLTINVFELGATYMKLRTALQLKEPMPEVDPAIYNIRFANRLDFGSANVRQIAADATRLVRRFRADWMTQGRRPAGVCGACMIIAARMSGFLRTPEEVAQVVKVSAGTIKLRLLEFARTQMASVTLQEWRNMDDAEFDRTMQGEAPPIVKQGIKRAKQLAERIEAQRLREQGTEGDDEEQASDDEGSMAGTSVAGAEGGLSVHKARARREAEKLHGRGHGEVDPVVNDDGAVQAAAEEYAHDADAGDDGQAEENDATLEAMEQVDYVDHLNKVRDNPDQVRRENAVAARAFKRQAKLAQGEDIEKMAKDVGDDFVGQLAENEGETDEEGDEDGGDDGMYDDAAIAGFTEWDNPEALHTFIADRYFKDEVESLKLTEDELKTRVQQWLRDRDPREVMTDMYIVDRARKERERYAKVEKETEFPDIDDEEIDREMYLRDDEKLNRARIWLKVNGDWLEKDAARRAKRKEAERTQAENPRKKTKRKAVHRGPYNTAREAMEGVAKSKKFSNRVNYSVLDALQRGDDDKYDEEYDTQLRSIDDSKEDDKFDDDDPSNW